VPPTALAELPHLEHTFVLIVDDHRGFRSSSNSHTIMDRGMAVALSPGTSTGWRGRHHGQGPPVGHLHPVGQTHPNLPNHSPDYRADNEHYVKFPRN
jgi:hypothetical protein